MLSTTHLSFKTYTKATAIAITKNALHVFIGSSLQSFTSSEETSTGKIVFLVMGALLGIGLLIYITMIVRKSLDELSIQDLESRLSPTDVEDWTIDTSNNWRMDESLLKSDTLDSAASANALQSSQLLSIERRQNSGVLNSWK